MADKQKREFFLQTQWLAYPEMPSGNFSYGRILAIGPGKLSLKGGASVVVDAQTRLLPSTGSSAIWEILRTGDLVCFQPEDRAQEVWLLAPNLTKVPEEISNSPRPERELLLKWSGFVHQIHRYFQSNGFVEINTPTLVTCPGTEPFLSPFATQLKLGHQQVQLFLPTSPELHLKKMLGRDMGPLYEIKSCFRNGEITEHHEPEFTMLEWYRPFSNLPAIEEDLLQLIQFLAPEKTFAIQRKSMRDLFQEFAQIDLRVDSRIEDYRSWAQKLNLHLHATDSISEIFHRIFLEKIEPGLPASELLIVDRFPPFQAAYSRLTADGWADRFELYWQGLEIANAFHEVNDPILQESRMREDLQLRKQIGKEDIPLDEEFLRSLRGGLPPSGGIALGVERLFMAMHGLRTIQSMKSFPYASLLDSL